MWTKEKQAEYMRAYYIANREKLLVRARENGKSPKAIAARVAYAAKNPAVMTKGKKAWQKRNPEKHRVKGLLNDAVRRGKITKPKTCSKCSKQGRIEGHHFDYSKPLVVIWLCRACHIAEHAK